MPFLNTAKRRTRSAVIKSLQATCNSSLPLPIKQTIIIQGPRLLTALDIESDDTPITSEYGTRFVAGPDDSPSNYCLRVRGVHEPVLSEFIFRHVQRGDICVDAGANIGYFTTLLARRVGPAGKVIAIEAGPHTARRLRANIDLNNATGIVTVINAACSGKRGELTFHVHPTVDAWSRVDPPPVGHPDRKFMGDQWNPVTVPADTLTALVGSDTDRVSFIKLDVEGEESAVAPQLSIDFPHPDLVVALEVREPIGKVLQPFADDGFYVYDLNNDYRWPYERAVPPIVAADYDDFTDRGQADVLLSRKPLDGFCAHH